MNKLQLSQLQNVLIATGLFFSSLLIFSLNIHHGFYVDELYHLLPARSVLVDGTLAVGNGEYLRAELYTRYIALLFSVFGESVAVARYSSALAVSILIVGVYFLFYKMIGRKEALLASLVLMIMPSTIYLAQFIRFYALHQLFFFIGAICFFYLVVNPLTLVKRATLVILSLVSLGAAYYLQVSTLIACVALASWFFFHLCFKVSNASTRTKQDAYLLVITVVVGIGLIALLVLQGKLSTLISDFRYAAPWSADNVDNHLFYHQLLRYQYPTFWTLFPFACFVALLYRAKPAFYFICLFSISLILFSLGGMKDERYIIFLYPYFVGIWSICIVAVLGKLKSMLQGVELPVQGFPAIPEKVINVLIFCGVIFVLLGNHAFPVTFHILNGQQYRHEIGDWSLAHDKVAPLVREADVVLTTNDVESLYFFGRYDFNASDYIFNEAKDQKLNVPDDVEYLLDKRTGLPIIAGIKQLESIVSCYRRGVFLGDARKWYKTGQGIGQQGVEYLENIGKKVQINSASLLIVYTWDNENILPEPKCQALYKYKSLE